MGIEYFRPKSLKEAINLLEMPNKIPLAGGTFLAVKKPNTNDLVDLQDLGLDKLLVTEQSIEIGATLKLQQLHNSQIFPESFRTAIKLEIPNNIRNSASIGGLIIKCDGRSSIGTSLLAMDTTVILEPGHGMIPLNDFLLIKHINKKKQLITSIKLRPLNFFTFQYVARSKFDRPIVSVAMSVFANGSTWLALGGFGEQPYLVCNMKISDNLPLIARDAYSHAEDEWATAEYRSAMVELLTKRCLSQFSLFSKEH